MQQTTKRRVYAGDSESYSLSPPISPKPISAKMKLENQSNSDEDIPADKFLRFKSHSRLPYEEKSFARDITVSQALSYSRHSFLRIDLILLGALSFLAFATRWYKIGLGDRAIWDEAHFGKFASLYIKREHHHDVHPPLAKLLIALIGKLAGYDGNHKFNSDDTFPLSMHHTFMRAMVAIFGAALVPLAYLTSKSLGLTRRCQIFSSMLVLFDNGLIVITKFLLLDPFLLCFTALTLLFLSEFNNYKDRPFCKRWWVSLIALGASMGLNASVKWGVPLFMVTLVGLYAINDLWNMHKDAKLSKSKYFRHWGARIFALIILPASLYLISFKIHFKVLNVSTKEDYIMDSVFIARLKGSGLESNRIEVASGANITLRATILNGGLLHSHPHFYPEGSKEQQVTSFREADIANYWTVESLAESGQVYKLKEKSVIRLRHQISSKLLTAQPDFDSPSSGSRAFEVSASSVEASDFRAHWEVLIYDQRQSPVSQGHIQAITTRVRFRNLAGNCLLASADRHLPAWAFSQLEVNCVKDSGSTAFETLWNFEFNQHTDLPIAPIGHIQSRFWWDIIRVHHAMWSTNVGLVPDPDRYSPIASVATDWPFLFKGIRMSSWEDSHVKFFMLGNPGVWWISSLSILIFFILATIYGIRRRRLCRDWDSAEWEQFKFIGYIVVGGWALHFLPFLFFSRVLYLHHYFPSLYFACIAAPYVIELSFYHLSNQSTNRTFGILSFCIIWCFYFFSPFTYGFDYAPGEIKNRRWLESWEFIDD